MAWAPIRRAVTARKGDEAAGMAEVIRWHLAAGEWRAGEERYVAQW